MRPEDVYALTSVGDPRLSPDGRRDRVRRHAGSTARRARTAARSGSRRSTAPRSRGSSPSGERRDGSPRWSPDGRWLAFVSNRDGEDEEKAKAQLYVMPADGGEPRKLTDGKESVESIAWSPDSTPHRLRAPRPRRRVRGGGRPQARRRDASRASSTSSTASAGPATAASTSSSSASTAATSASSPTATARTTRRRGRPTASASSSARCAATAGTSTSGGALRARRRRRREPSRSG